MSALIKNSMDNNKNEPSMSFLKYEGLLGHLRFGWLKLRSMARIHGFLKAVNLIRGNFFLVEFLYRMEGRLFDIAQPLVSSTDLRLGRISTVDSLLEWNHLPDLMRLRGSYGLVQAQMRLSHGYILHYACLDESLAGFLWLAASDSTEAGYRIKAHEEYCIDGWTFPQFRGRGILPKLFQYLAATPRETTSSVDTLVAHVAPVNKASISAQRKAGMRIATLEVSIVFLGFHRKYRLRTYHAPDSLACIL